MTNRSGNGGGRKRGGGAATQTPAETTADQQAATSGDAGPEQAIAAEAVEAVDKDPKAHPDAAEDATILSETSGAEAETETSADATPRGRPTDAAAEVYGDEEDGDEPPRATPAAAASPASSGGWFAPAAVGGVVGAVAAVLGGFAMAPAPVDPSRFATPTDLAQTVEVTLAESVSAAEARLAENVSAVSAQAEAARAAAAEAGAAATGAATAAQLEREALTEAQAALTATVAEERAKLARLTEQLATRESERAAAVEAIREQVASLAAAVAATPSGGVLTASGSEADGASPVAADAGAATRLALLEGGLRRLEARLNGLSAEALPTPDLTRIDALETASSQRETALASLDARVAQLEAAELSAASGEAAVGVAFSALVQAVAGTSPYEDQLAVLSKVAALGDVDPALSGPAGKGLPSPTSLATRFDPAARKALTAAARARAASGEGDMMDRLSGLFTVRSTAEPDPEAEGVDAALARAEARIDEGDVHAALAELSALPPEAAAAMSDWIASARSRADAETALGALRARLLGATQ